MSCIFIYELKGSRPSVGVPKAKGMEVSLDTTIILDLAGVAATSEEGKNARVWTIRMATVATMSKVRAGVCKPSRILLWDMTLAAILSFSIYYRLAQCTVHRFSICYILKYLVCWAD